MLTHLSVDLGTVVLLAIVVWLDGWRRFPDGAVLVARPGLGPWRVRAPWTRVGAFALVAWWEPIIVPLLLSSSPDAPSVPRARWMNDFGLAVTRGRRRLRRVRAERVVLRGLGVLTVLWIIVGIPVATARFGGPGLIAGVVGALALAVETMVIAALALRSLGLSWGRSLRMSAPLLSPFGAPRAAGIVTGIAVGPLHSIAPAAALLGDARFLAWVRPWAYDALSHRDVDGCNAAVAVADLVRALPRDLLERAVAPTVHDTGDGERYCPRCIRTYREVIETCTDCDDLALVAVQGSPAGRQVV
jgi:hypothetical protein